MIATDMLEATDTRANPATRFLDALGRRDFEEIEGMLAPNMWFRALLPRKLHKSTNAGDTMAALRGWFGGASDFRVVGTDHHTLAGREYIMYRFLLRPDWAPEQWHVIEQAGFLRLKDGVISRLDLVCTGFFPVDEAVERVAA